MAGDVDGTREVCVAEVAHIKTGTSLHALLHVHLSDDHSTQTNEKWLRVRKNTIFNGWRREWTATGQIPQTEGAGSLNIANVLDW